MRTCVKGEQEERTISNAVKLPHVLTTVNVTLVGAVFSDRMKSKPCSFQLLHILLRCTQTSTGKLFAIIEFNVHLMATYLRVKRMFNVWLDSACGHIGSRKEGMDTGFLYLCLWFSKPKDFRQRSERQKTFESLPLHNQTLPFTFLRFR